MAQARVRVPLTSVWRGPQDATSTDAAITRAQPDAAQWVGSLDNEAKLALESRMDTQALLGEPVLVVEEVGEWAHVRLPWQPSSRSLEGYPGWIPRAHLLWGRGDISSPCDGVVVIARITEAIAEGGEHLSLSFGTVLAVVDDASPTLTLRHPDGRLLRLRRDDVSIGDERCTADLVELAYGFLELSYLWGGMSGHGVDCSGLVHLCHRVTGQVVPRDAHDQSLQGQSVRDEDVRPGDSVYFENQRGVHHTGFAVDGARLLHSPRTGRSVGFGSIDDYPGELHGFRRFSDA